MSSKKSSKDIAFEKERAKYRKQIREAEYESRERLLKIHELEEIIDKKDEEIIRLSDWVERLLEYTGLSEEEMRMIIFKDKIDAQFACTMNNVTRMFQRFI